ncbi:hypothetical protein [Rothia endophytica]|uniref:Uncharacterized protein n=1 Tax=Rothia endophytica TaxID=1324766 RepID=A0ABP9BWM2_9MICC
MTDPLPSPLKHAGRRAFLRAAVLGAAVLPLAACVGDEDSLAKQAREGNNKNYIAGDGSVEEYGPGPRVPWDAPLGLDPAHQHAHRTLPAAAPGGGGGARLALPQRSVNPEQVTTYLANKPVLSQ